MRRMALHQMPLAMWQARPLMNTPFCRCQKVPAEKRTTTSEIRNVLLICHDSLVQQCLRLVLQGAACLLHPSMAAEALLPLPGHRKRLKLSPAPKEPTFELRQIEQHEGSNNTGAAVAMNG